MRGEVIVWVVVVAIAVCVNSVYERSGVQAVIVVVCGQ